MYEQSVQVIRHWLKTLSGPKLLELAAGCSQHDVAIVLDLSDISLKQARFAMGTIMGISIINTLVECSCWHHKQRAFNDATVFRLCLAN